MLEDLTFGIECECHIPRNTSIQRNGWHSNIPLSINPTNSLSALNNWRAESDGSLTAPTNRLPIEFISPVLKGADGLRNVYAAYKCIKETLRAQSNTSCGTHVHIGFPQDPNAIKRLLHIVGKHESGLYATCGTNRRETGSYSSAIKHRYDPNRLRFTVSRRSNGRDRVELAEHYNNLHDRYRSINLSSWLSGGPTVEFRLFSNTVVGDKAVAWIRLCLGMVEKALKTKRVAKWHHKDTALVKTCKGRGLAAFQLLMYDMGWTKGRSFVRDKNHPNADRFGRVRDENGNLIPLVWGNLLGEELPSLKDSHATLLRLAKNYDTTLTRSA